MADATEGAAHETSYLPPRTPPTNHGHTVAAWVTMTLVLVGVGIAAAAVVAAVVWLFWVGLGVVVLALVVGKVLAVLGYGQTRPSGSEGPK